MDDIIKQQREIKVYTGNGETTELVQITIDMKHLALHLGRKAVHNKHKQSGIYNAGVSVRHIATINPQTQRGAE